jgi:pimeloyl-ACP methyl ester carboxylesterase
MQVPVRRATAPDRAFVRRALNLADARRITQPVLGVFGAESALIWPGWKEVQERLCGWLPQTEPFVLAGANHALEERDPRGFARYVSPPPNELRIGVARSRDTSWLE